MPDQNPTADGRMAPPEFGIAVRMYQLGGLGDCFLLAFRADDGGARYMLIDCGILSNNAEAIDRIRKVAQSIAEATGGHLHVFVVTHEHWDHVSGLQHARSVFDELVIDEVWLAWTEDPSDPLARRLAEKHALALQALSIVSARLTAMNRPQANSLAEVLSFQGGVETASGKPRGAQAIDYIRSEKEGVVPRFLSPGGPPLRLPNVPGVKIYVLGPPRDEGLLSRSNPSRKRSEVYETMANLSASTAFYAAALAATERCGETPTVADAIYERSLPFQTCYRINMEQAETDPFFRAFYGFETDGDGPAWRRIDSDWLAAAEGLALHLDNDTNNTSVVLAIEIESNKSVLLFTGDAQVGNWLSWHDVSFPDSDTRTSQVVTGADLLHRTVLYKVGHHGSHNATLRDEGLEMMQNPGLVAMIPVDEDEAKARQWAMPFRPLLDRLETKTRGRVIRADKGLPDKPPDVLAVQWQEFLTHIRQKEGLWIEYTVIG